MELRHEPTRHLQQNASGARIRSHIVHQMMEIILDTAGKYRDSTSTSTVGTSTRVRSTNDLTRAVSETIVDNVPCIDWNSLR